MVHSDKLNRGVIDKSHPISKIAVSLDANYSSLLSSCICKLWDHDIEQNSGHSFYLADSTGARIEPSLKWFVSGSKKELEWTLDNYIKLSGRYPSKLRLYCVLMDKTGMRINNIIISSLDFIMFHS